MALLHEKKVQPCVGGLVRLTTIDEVDKDARALSAYRKIGKRKYLKLLSKISQASLDVQAGGTYYRFNAMFLTRLLLYLQFVYETKQCG